MARRRFQRSANFRPFIVKGRYRVPAPVGVGFETPEGGFFVRTLFVESALERARQEFASGRSVVTAAIYDRGKITRIVDADDFREHAAGCGCHHCYTEE